ncbi:MAG: DNA polymerase III subunit alpha [Thermodesulfovibrionales bacterium]|nr:DNA polymerase III subunit alpha [Thermodesulfovibrionales bacterium]
MPVSATKEINLKTAIEITLPLKEAYESNPQIKELLDIAIKLEGLARHASVHAAGVVIAPQPLTEYTALYRGAKGDETVTTQFDLESIEKIGLLKFDFLGLDTLTIIDTTQKYIRQKEKDFDINNIPLDDKETYRLLSSGRTAGVFQLESSGMRELLMKMEPDRFDDLIALVALYRPGPLGSGMVEDFIKRKKGLVSVKYELPELKDILDETYGVILYQEQVMRISNRIAGFTLGQADILRRAISKKDPFLMEELKTKFINGAVERGYSEDIARRLFELIEYFGNYGFNKSHSAAYALVAYQTAYLKAHYPVEFMAASLTAEVDKTDKILRLINECREMGIEVLPPDINKSEEAFTIDGRSIRFGLKAVKGVGEAAIESIKEERSKKPFDSFEDFLKRLVERGGNGSQDSTRKLNKKVIEALIKAGAFDSLGISRKDALARLDLLQQSPKNLSPLQSVQPSMFDISVVNESSETGADRREKGKQGDVSPSLQHPSSEEALNLAYEKEALGFYITGHPVKPFRPILRTFGLRSSEELKSFMESKNTSLSQEIFVAGLVLELKKHKTKGKNELMAFITLEDEEGSFEAVVFPELYKRSIKLFEKGSIIVVKGNTESSEKGFKIIAREVEDFDTFIKNSLLRASRVILKLKSDEFRKEKFENFAEFLKTCQPSSLSLSAAKGLPFYINVIMPDFTVTIQSSYSIIPDLRFLRLIEDLFGRNSLEVIL